MRRLFLPGARAPSRAAIAVPPLFALALIAACGGSDGGPGPTAASVLTTVTVTPASNSVFSSPPQNSVSLKVTAKDQNGQTITGTPSFSSSNEAVATVNSGGLVTAVSPGTALITVSLTINGVTQAAVATVSVEDPPLDASVFARAIADGFQPTAVHVQAGGTVTWTTEALPHTVTFTTAGSPGSIGFLLDDSDSRTFPTPGSFSYECQIHPTMLGVVHVH